MSDRIEAINGNTPVSIAAAQAEIAALRGVVIHAGKLLAAVDTHLEAIVTDSEGNADIEKPFSLCEIAASRGLTQGCAEVLREYDHFIKQSRDAIAAELKAIKAALATTEPTPDARKE